MELFYINGHWTLVSDEVSEYQKKITLLLDIESTLIMIIFKQSKSYIYLSIDIYAYIDNDT